MVRDMLKECSRMSTFNHIHVLTLKGVCLDGGPAPYIIMPFMANGSLLAYLKKNRKSLVLSSENDDGEDVNNDNYKSIIIQLILKHAGGYVLAAMIILYSHLATMILLPSQQATDGYVYSGCQGNGISC